MKARSFGKSLSFVFFIPWKCGTSTGSRVDRGRRGDVAVASFHFLLFAGIFHLCLLLSDAGLLFVFSFVLFIDCDLSRRRLFFLTPCERCEPTGANRDAVNESKHSPPSKVYPSLTDFGDAARFRLFSTFQLIITPAFGSPISALALIGAYSLAQQCCAG